MATAAGMAAGTGRYHHDHDNGGAAAAAILGLGAAAIIGGVIASQQPRYYAPPPPVVYAPPPPYYSGYPVLTECLRRRMVHHRSSNGVPIRASGYIPAQPHVVKLTRGRNEQINPRVVTVVQ